MPRRGRASSALAVLAVLTGAATACGGSDAPAAKDTTTTAPTSLTFYRPGSVLPAGTPGEILSQRPIELDPRMHATGYAITYVSTTPAGDLVPETGVMMVPTTPKPAAGRPVVVWAHGTTGIGDDCAPSRHPPVYVSGAEGLLDAGVLIAMPDYEGLGVPEEDHPYLVAEAAARSVLDAARAAHHFGGNAVTVTWGWSQGGHASLVARAEQPSYAPDLDLRGAAAQAPVTDVGTFLLPGRTDASVFPFTAEAILTWSAVYDEVALTDLIEVHDAEKARLALQACTGDIADGLTKPLDQIFRSDPQSSDIWRAAVELNSATVGESTAPVLLTHGDADVLVPVAGTVAMDQALCEAKVATRFLRVPTWDHYAAFFLAHDEVTPWILDRIAGKEPAPSSCPPG